MIQNLLVKDKGVCIFVFPIPKDTSAFERFPEPVIPEEWGDDTGNGFLDWSEGVMRAPVSPHVFDPKVHAYTMTHADPPAMIFGVIGPLDKVYKWAEFYRRSSSKEARFDAWTKNAAWLDHEDLIRIESEEVLEEQVEDQEVDNFGKVVDIEDDKTVQGIADSIYDGSKPLTKAETDELHDAIQE
jgi:hypothetical protein